MEKQRNNSYLGAAEKREKAHHSQTEKKLPQRRGRRREKKLEWRGIEEGEAHREGEGAGAVSLSNAL